MPVRICHLSQPSQTSCNATLNAAELVTSCEITSHELCDVSLEGKVVLHNLFILGL